MSINLKKPRNNSNKNKPQCLTVHSLDELDSKLLFSVCVQNARLNLGQNVYVDDRVDSYIFIKNLIKEKYYEDWFKSDLENLASEYLPFTWEEISDAFKNKSPAISRESVISTLQKGNWNIPFEGNYIHFIPFAVKFLDINNIEVSMQSLLNPMYSLKNNELELDLDAITKLYKDTPQNSLILKTNTKKIYEKPKTNNINDSAKEENACNMSIPYNTGIELLAGFDKQNFFEIASNDFQQYLDSCMHNTDNIYRKRAKDYYTILKKTNWKIPKDLFCHIRYFSGLNNVANSLVGINRTLYGHPND